MHYRTLGARPVSVSLLGYGGWALGGTGWPGTNERLARQALETAVEAGITLYDTAPVYGFGRSERIMGEVLAPVRSRIILATKCGLRWTTRGHVLHDLSRDAILRDIDASLKRLRTCRIDLYQIHWPDPKTPLEDALEVLVDLASQDMIDHIGLCNVSAAQLQRCMRITTPTCVQNRYNLLQRGDAEQVLPLCRAHGIGFACYSPLAQGLLGGSLPRSFRPGKRDIRRFNPLFADVEAQQQRDAIAGPPAAAALKFLAAQPAVSTILVSMTRPEHVRQNAAYLAA